MIYEKIKYPDGSQYVDVKQFPTEFTFRIGSYEDLWTLNQIADVYRHRKIRATVNIPFLFEGQADRRFKPTQPSGLALVAQFINTMGWEKVRIFHPHNPEVVEALFNNVEIIDNADFITAVLLDKTMPLGEKCALMSVDAGGFKPLLKVCDKIRWKGETFSASKSRSFKDGRSVLTQTVDTSDYGNRNILIIDDICVKGGTFIGLAKLLKARNCGKLFLAVSHMTSTPNPELFELFDMVFTTDSLPTLPNSKLTIKETLFYYEEVHQ